MSTATTDDRRDPRLIRQGLRGAVQAACLSAAVLAAAGAVGASRGPVVLDTPQGAAIQPAAPLHATVPHAVRSR